MVAGVLLLFKEKLRRLSPEDSDEVLIKARVLPIADANGFVSFRGSGGKTVDVSEIRERFKALGIKTDWERVRALVDLRNDIEHYRTEASSAVMRTLVAKTFFVIADFILTELDENPVDLLGELTWTAFQTEGEFYDDAKQSCAQSMSRLVWPMKTQQALSEILACATCDSDVIRPKDIKTPGPNSEFECIMCGHLSEFSEIVEPACAKLFFADTYIAMTEGGDSPIDTCHECGRETFVLEEGQCAACLATLSYKTCFCGETLGPGDQDNNGLCGYHAYQAGKDD